MSNVGLAINYRGWSMPNKENLYRLGMHKPNRWLRTVIYDYDDFEEIIKDLPSNIKLCVMFSRQCKQVAWDYSNLAYQAAAFAERFKGKVHAVEMDNELDIWFDVDKKLTPEYSASLVKQISSPMRQAGIMVLPTSVAGGTWFNYLAKLAPLVRPYVDAINFHPYVKKIKNFPAYPDWGEMENAIKEASQIAGGMPVACTELGIKIGDVGGEPAQAEYVTRAFSLLLSLPESLCPFGTYFCYYDGTGTAEEQGNQAFGLVRLDGTPRPAYYALAKLLGGEEMPMPEAEFVLGFKQMHDSNPDLVGTPLRNEKPPKPGVHYNTQPTTKGICYWTWALRLDGGAEQVMGFTTLAGQEYLWDGSKLVAA